MAKKTREEKILQLKANIKGYENRIEDLKKRGDAACSRYDLMYGYDANFYLNICPIPMNNLNATKRELNELLGKVEIVQLQLSF